MTIPIEFLILPFFAFLCYFPSINGPFLFDDRDSVLRNQRVMSGNWRRALASPWRGLTLGTYALQCVWPGTSRSFHIGNILIHGANGWILQRIALAMGHDLVTADRAAILYICLPFAANAVSYITGRAAILSATFSLLGVWAILAGAPLAAVPMLGLAVWAKEDGMAFTALFAALHLWTGSPWGLLWIAVPAVLLVLPRFKGMPPIFHALHFRGIRRLMSKNASDNMIRGGLPGALPQPEHAWTVFVETVLAVPAWAFGLRQSPYQGSGVPAAKISLREIAAVFGAAAAFAGYFVFPALQIPLLLIAIGPWMLYMAIPCPDQLIEYRYYSCAAGISLLFTDALAPANPFVWAGVIGIAASLTAWQAHAWSSGPRFWAASIYRGCGEKSRAWQELGAEYKIAGDLPAAAKAFRKALELNPNLAPAMRNLAWVYWLQQKPEEALAMMKACTSRCPAHTAGWEEYGCMLEMRHLPGEAEIALRRALFLDPKSALAGQRLGMLLFTREAYHGAEEQFRERFTADPKIENRWNLGWALKMLGRIEEAREVMKPLPPEIQMTNDMVMPQQAKMKAVTA